MHYDTMLIDTHTHLFMEPLRDDLDGVLARAAAAGVRGCVVPAYDLESWAAIRSLADRENVHVAGGLHPWVAQQPWDELQLGSQLQDTAAVAVGEIGLDFKVPDYDPVRQIDTFRRQLAVAVDLDLPVILHNRGAFEEMADILDEFKGAVRGVLHAYSRGPELAERFLGLGLHLAFGGTITRPGARRARRSAAMIPEDRLLLETDSPAIGLHDILPENTEPRHVRNVAAAMADLRGTNLEHIAKVTSDNARRLFKLP
jgi:TatD DNase family protein